MAVETSDWCQFKNVWLDDSTRKYRCPECNKRLTPMEITDRFSGEFIGYNLPPHKTKGHKIKRLKSRSSKRRKNG